MMRPVWLLLLALCVAAAVGNAQEREAEDTTGPAGAQPAKPAQPDATPALDAVVEKRIVTLVQNLGSDFASIRADAEKELLEYGTRAVPELERALKSDDAAVVAKVKRLLEQILAHAYQVIDALGQPIAAADVEVVRGAEIELSLVTDTRGYIALPQLEGNTSGVVTRVTHEQYGVAPGRFVVKDAIKRLQVPLVRRGTEAFQRAAQGQVVDPEGEPVVGATIRCTSIRTPGFGLINVDTADTVVSDAEGRFVLYSPNHDRRNERGDLIPPNSNYALLVEPPPWAGLFPYSESYPNTKPARIELQRPEREFALTFHDANDAVITDRQQLEQISLIYQRADRTTQVSLGTRLQRTGRGRLLAGLYEARLGNIAYQPVTVDADSPDELHFRLPPPVTYHGRVVDGRTGAPLAGAVVFGYSSTSRNNLALLTDEQWDALHGLPAGAGLDHPAVQPLKKLYGVQAVTLTDEEGRYEIVQPRAQKFYGIVVAEQNYLPFMHRTSYLKPDETHRAAVVDTPLFPAAKLIVQPVLKERASVSPHWLVAANGQPEWYEQFKAAPHRSERQFECVHWLEQNESQPILVPARLRLRVEFRTPYEDQWTPTRLDRVIELPQGESLDVGEVHFAPALKVDVLVVGPLGEPVEGAPVRRMQAGTNAWSVPHNTDAQGLAQFYVYPNSKGRFRALDLRSDVPAEQKKNIYAAFEVTDKPPEDGPYVIRLTAAQVRRLRGVGGS